MSDDINDPASTPPPPEDQYKNIKGEFNRKIDKTNELVNQLIQSQAQLQEALGRIAQPAAAPAAKGKEEKLEDIMYTDPARYTQIIEERATERALTKMRSETTTQSSVNQAIAQLVAEYPELADAENELTKASAEILKGVSDSERTNPRTYEYAVMKAAQKLEVQPKSKRKQSEDEFVAPSYSSPQARSKKRSTEQVVNQNKDFGRAVGVNLDDPKMKEQFLNLLKSKGQA
jgi:hypothetical protein